MIVYIQLFWKDTARICMKVLKVQDYYKNVFFIVRWVLFYLYMLKYIILYLLFNDVYDISFISCVEL